MEPRKLNIGSGQWVIPGYVNIDNGSDYGNPEIMMAYADNYMKHDLKEMCEFMIMDGNNMSFEDESFDEVLSTQCVGEYVTNYEEIVRVLKPGGIIKLGVWNSHVARVLGHLIRVGIKVTSVSWLNGSYEDIDSEDEYWTLMIIGTKEI